MQEKIGHLLIPPFPDTRRLAATAPYLCNFYYLHPDILAAYNRINLVSCHCNNRYALSQTAFVHSKTIIISHIHYLLFSPRNAACVSGLGEHIVWQHRAYREYCCIIDSQFLSRMRFR